MIIGAFSCKLHLLEAVFAIKGALQVKRFKVRLVGSTLRLSGILWLVLYELCDIPTSLNSTRSTTRMERGSLFQMEDLLRVTNRGTKTISIWCSNSFQRLLKLNQSVQRSVLEYPHYPYQHLHINHLSSSRRQPRYEKSIAQPSHCGVHCNHLSTSNS